MRSLPLLASIAAMAGAATPFLGDHASLPPEPAAMHALLGTRQPLTELIAAAEAETGGLASEAAFGQDGTVRVHTYSAQAHFVVELEAASGAVLARETRARFPGAPVEGGWTETPSGLKYFDLVVGPGPEPAGPGATVKIHYSGWLTNGTKIDSSVDRGQPLECALNSVVKGWTEGIGSMRVGGKRKLLIPHALAYGLGGRPPFIPPAATLIYDVELLEILK